jgi:Spy/CpxP family protein refolding chaperone
MENGASPSRAADQEGLRMELRTMAQMNKTKRAIAMTGLLAGLALSGASAFAQTRAPAAPADKGGAMMDHGTPNGQGRMMPGMMMNGEMQQKMTRMMDNCNRMMESMMQNKDGAPAKKD